MTPPTALAIGVALLGAGSSSSLVVAARVGVPAECARRLEPLGARGASRVSVARRRACAELARGHARLGSAPGDALRAAERAALLDPSALAPLVLAARALHAVGRDAEAWERLAAVAPRLESVESPDALLDLARVELAVGRLDEARGTYRRLALRAAWLTPRWRRAVALTEVGLAVLGEGPAALGEALAQLREAERQWAGVGAHPVVAASLALALDRAGRGAEARSAARAVDELEGLERRLEPSSTWGARLAPLAAERLGMLAVVAALRGDADAPARWAEAARAGGPWAGHAQRRAEERAR